MTRENRTRSRRCQTQMIKGFRVAGTVICSPDRVEVQEQVVAGAEVQEHEVQEQRCRSRRCRSRRCRSGDVGA